MTAPRVERLTTAPEVNVKPHSGIFQQSERRTSFCFLGQIFAARTASTTLPEKTLCRTSRPTTSWTRPARRPGSTTPSFPSGPRPAVNLEQTASTWTQDSHSQTLTSPFIVSPLPSSDAKKKLRLALCSADSVALPIMAPAITRNGLPDHMDSEGTPSLCEKNDALRRMRNQSHCARAQRCPAHSWKFQQDGALATRLKCNCARDYFSHFVPLIMCLCASDAVKPLNT